ncbi:hypothetical protein [Ruania halotolerans]|uniref:hypothetical protein n=1 Tax=Ruania halotolerans TaxID=2897773 RepID=UPI001E4FE911|nr:hypothetical protein [Ruania halotolerans]UFU07310.1 hypothetical protein LQF10_04145 [Ruania halotolerans]
MGRSEPIRFYGQNVEFAGWVVLAIAVMFFGYLLPTVIRSRQVVMDSRVADRFSAELRVLARSGTNPTEPLTISSSRGYLHRPRTEEENPMHSPVAQRLAAADMRRAAAARAARAAAASRRAAAAKRRLVLTLMLLAATIGGWAVVGMSTINVAAGIVPTVAFLGVLVLGRRAAAAARVADERWVAEIERARKADETRAARRAGPVQEKPSSLRIDIDPMPMETAPHVPATRPDLPTGEGWTPVPVPAPMYTMKPAAPRRENAPITAEEAAPMAQEIATADAAHAAEQAQAQADVAGSNRTVPGPSVDLQAVLERRRAVGQ